MMAGSRGGRAKRGSSVTAGVLLVVIRSRHATIEVELTIYGAGRDSWKEQRAAAMEMRGIGLKNS